MHAPCCCHTHSVRDFRSRRSEWLRRCNPAIPIRWPQSEIILDRHPFIFSSLLSSDASSPTDSSIRARQRITMESMDTSRAVTRSFSLEPDEKHIDDLRVLHFSDSPWVPEDQLSPADGHRLERIAPSNSPAAERAIYASTTAGHLSEHTHSGSMSNANTVPASGYFDSPHDSSNTVKHPIPGPDYSGLPLLHNEYPPQAGSSPMFAATQLVDVARALRAHDEKAEDATGPPDWLGIFFDLAWTMTFSNLSNGTALTSVISLLNYGIFFSLAWMLWAAQVLYDTKYYSNDWFHRIMLLLQLVTFAALSAFTKDFDAFNKNIDPHAAPLDEFAAVNYSRKTNLGISALFAGARLLLVISYIRVLLHLPKYPSARKQRKRLVFQIVAYLASGIIFTVAFFVVKTHFNPSVRPIKLILWGTGLSIEILVYLFVPEVDGRLLVNVDTMGERISTLTTVILGEGVNGLGQTLILTASTTGFTVRLGGIILTLGLVILFAFLLYFDGLRRSTPSTRRRSRVNVLLHFPLHLAIIVLLQSLNNNLIFISMQDQLDTFLAQVSKSGADGSTDSLIKAFRNIGIDAQAIVEAGIVRQQQANGGQPTSDEDFNELNQMLSARAVLNIFQDFNEVSDEMAVGFSDYIYSYNSSARTDLGTFNPQLIGLMQAQLQNLDASSLWITLAAGAYLIGIALIALVNAWVPQHRYIWISSLGRAGMGLLVAAVTVLKVTPSIWTKLHDNGWLPATIAIAFITQFVLDQILIRVATNRHKRTWMNKRQRVL
ncbi:hypothetical protein BKA62DRAFT_498704 [Auriculariales sp. MPI-PUGE-AT-0066]|nr:hypothetical protein BKA62DRAFT_498704 [Auriculariales sp. MPI-PUGE-AT-0066]